MDQLSPRSGPEPEPRRVGPVEPDLLASAMFLFAEYLQRLEAELPEDDEEETGPAQIETRAVLDLFAEELGTDVMTTLNLFMRVTALHRLLAASPSLAQMALGDDETGSLRDEALVAAARLGLQIHRVDGEGSADFDPREFREAMEDS